MFFVVVTAFLMSTIRYETVEGKNSTTNLVDNIRRQLMRDNYDYMSSADDDILLTTNQSFHDNHHFHDADRNNPNNDVTIPRAQNDGDDSIQDVTVLDKDLVYYINDERLEKATVGNLDDLNFSEDLNATTPKVKYKVLKVKNPNRRSMTFQRFIQEEKDDGLAIINLDDGPFPEFRLPKSRRQYMQDIEDFEDGITLSQQDDQRLENSTKIRL